MGEPQFGQWVEHQVQLIQSGEEPSGLPGPFPGAPVVLEEASVQKVCRIRARTHAVCSCQDHQRPRLLPLQRDQEKPQLPECWLPKRVHRTAMFFCKPIGHSMLSQPRGKLFFSQMAITVYSTLPNILRPLRNVDILHTLCFPHVSLPMLL